MSLENMNDDIKNKEELSLEDMKHAIVTLQKQSNNYKRLLYLIVPVMIGTTILVLNLIKETTKINTCMYYKRRF
jgi:uncharacterized membrane protein YjjP (DUF1212 family)